MQVAFQRSMANMAASCSGAGAAKQAPASLALAKGARRCVCIVQQLESSSVVLPLLGRSRRRGTALRAVEYATYGTDLSFPLEGYLVLVSCNFSIRILFY
jgi:hypothetical protein